MCMEAVLLEKPKSDVLARLMEAVAYRLGTSKDDRKRLRERVSALYDARCRFVHDGEATAVTAEEREEADAIVGRTLMLEVLEFA